LRGVFVLMRVEDRVPQVALGETLQIARPT
jgi:hypothetical protein